MLPDRPRERRAAIIAATIASALLCLISIHSDAASPGDTLRTFGLVGTWSDDCAQKSSSATYDASETGAATLTSVVPIPRTDTQLVLTFQIDEATLMPDNKIKFVAKIRNVTRSDGNLPPTLGRSPLRIILEKDGARTRVIDDRAVDGTHVNVENGIQRATGIPVPFREKCQN
jgi:hypothetical protein